MNAIAHSIAGLIGRRPRLWVLGLALLANLALLSAVRSIPDAAGSSSVANASAKTIKKTCRNRVWPSDIKPLCKPRVGIWTGTATQDTPSGPATHKFTFEIDRKGPQRSGTDLNSFDLSVPWYCGEGFSQGPYIWASGPQTGEIVATDISVDGRVYKETGQFFLSGETESGTGERESGLVRGDFVNKRRAKGTFTAEQKSSEGVAECSSRKVTWTASPGG